MGLFSFGRSSNIDWVDLTSEEQLLEFVEGSHETPVVFFKHSTRCGISRSAIKSFESDWDLSNEDIIPVYLDLLAYRPISNVLAENFNIRHESPQVIMVKDGQAVYNASHHHIDVNAIKKLI